MMDDVHCIMSKSNHLKFLADWINLRTTIYSPGDELILLGVYFWWYAPYTWIVLVVREMSEKGLDLE
jgi:hypothetical protein